MEIIRENFRRISRSKAKGAMTLSAEYDRCLEADNLIAQRVECAEDEYREISNEILIIDQRLASLEKAYAKGGGISKKEWRSMQDQIAKEDVRREGHHKWLKELANNVLPFIILRTQLEELKSQIALEHKAQVDAFFPQRTRTQLLELRTKMVAHFCASKQLSSKMLRYSNKRWKQTL